MYKISREYHFSAAHRLEDHPKCGRLHGHNYRVIVWLASHDLDENLGWILDFADVDGIVKPIIEEFDHRYIVSDDNVERNCPYLSIAEAAGDAVRIPIAFSTAELIAWYIFKRIEGDIGTHGSIFVSRVDVWETPKSCASFTK